MTNDLDLITDDMRACIGTASPAVQLPDEISASDVRRFVSLIGETNPIYQDETYARRLGYAGRVVPPMLVLSLIFRRLEDSTGHVGRIGIDWPNLRLPAEYANTRNAGQEYAWFRPVYVGDRLTIQAHLTDIHARRGRSGIPAIYLVSETEFRNQHGELVVRQTSIEAKMPTASAKAG